MHQRDDDAIRQCRAILEANSKSFALAGKLLPPKQRDDAAVVYAYCRRVDDAIDECTGDPRDALATLRDELEWIFATEERADHPAASDVTLRAFRVVAQTRRIPRAYPEELLAGMEMDVVSQSYPDVETLLLYCHRVAGVVGLMMCHVMGVRDDDALRNAAQLGLAMQLTNICRDVLEDWRLGRLYLPDSLLAQAGASHLRDALGGPFPAEATAPVSEVVESLLKRADTFYEGGDRGLEALSLQNALAIAAARRIYAAIGDVVRSRACDVRFGRAVVPLRRKLALTAAAARSVTEGAWSQVRERDQRPLHLPGRIARFPDDVI